jgi:hypothetical protein
VSSIEPDRDSGEIDGGEKVSCRFVITGGKGTELFELTKEVLDPVACLVEVLIVFTLDLAIGLGWNDRGFAGSRQRLQNPFVGLVALIGNDNGCFQDRQ